MFRATGPTVMGVVALVTVVLVFGLVGGTLLLGAPAHAGPSAAGAVGKSTASPSTARTSGVASSAASPSAVLATVINLNFIHAPEQTPLPAITSTPQNFSFYVNITAGPVSNSVTKAWVQLYDTVSSTVLTTFSLNGTITATDPSWPVTTFVNNGITYENYTWNVSLDKTTLGCTTVSCTSAITPGSDNLFFVTVTVQELAGATWGNAEQSITTSTTLVSTYPNVVSLLPLTGSNVPLPAVVSFETNISWGYTTNATTDAYLVIDEGLSYLSSISFNNTVNTTNAAGDSSSVVFNGTVNGAVWSDYVWTAELNATTLKYTGTGNTTFGTGTDMTILLFVSENGAGFGAGGGATGTVNPENTSVAVGTTFVFGGDFNYPAPYQGLNFTEKGWVNISWAVVTNATYDAYYLAYNTVSGLVAYISGNHTANASTAVASFLLVFNGKDALGVPWTNYTWSVTLTSADLAAAWSYVPMDVLINATFTGNVKGGGGVTQTGIDFLIVDTVFSENPTTISVKFTNSFTGHVGFPYDLNFTITTNGPIDPSVTTLTAVITDSSIPAVIAVDPITVVPGQSTYTFVLDAATLDCYYNDPGCAVLPPDPYIVSIYANESGILAPLNGTNAAGELAIGPAFFITVPEGITLLSPTPGTSPAIGPITFTTLYTGQYVTGANLTVYAGVGSTVKVFTASMTQLHAGVPATAVWPASHAGTYPVVAEASSLTGVPFFAYLNLTVTAVGSGTVYTNTSTYHNATLGGLSVAAWGTLLLVVGLIIGIILALVIGRVLWSAPKQPAAAQPWTPGTAGTPPANTCPTCGKSFASADELTAHEKAEHGMQ